jgi:glutamyl-tRNA reductase
MVLNKFKIIALTHKSSGMEHIGRFYIEETDLGSRLAGLKAAMGWDEVVYLATCNRVEFLISVEAKVNNDYLLRFFTAFDNNWVEGEMEQYLSNFEVYEGAAAVLHLFKVASSLDSMVIGEREIITQVRNAYDKADSCSLSGDLLRLVIKKTIQIAKEVYSNTDIAKKPVSVVSLAYRKLKDLNVEDKARILIVGAGKTNTVMARYLKKHGFVNLTVFSRTLSKAQKLAKDLNGQAQPLETLSEYKNGFEVIISCTGAADYIITKPIYETLLNGDTTKKIVIDLAVPNDFDPKISDDYKVNLIAINNLKDIAEENLKERQNELVHCKQIIENGLQDFIALVHERQVERAMSKIPEKVKEISNTAVNAVFAKDLAKLDHSSRATLDKVLAYVERKYISVPMKMAKEVLLDKKNS